MSTVNVRSLYDVLCISFVLLLCEKYIQIFALKCLSNGAVREVNTIIGMYIYYYSLFYRVGIYLHIYIYNIHTDP